MSTSSEQPTSNEQSIPRTVTTIQGTVQQLIQIAQVQGSVNLLGQDVIDKLHEAIAALRRGVDNSRQMREAVAQVLALLRKKNALYAHLNDEIWEYVFKSLRELRDALAQASSKLHIDGPRFVRSLLDLMVVAIRKYLAQYETKYTRFMQSERQDLAMTLREREWPELPYAARDLLSLRELLIAAIAPLNAYAEEGQAVHWDQKDFTIRKHELKQAKPEPFDRTPLQTRDDSTTAALIDALKDEKDWVRWSAADALFTRVDPAAVSALVEALADEEGYVRQRAADALQRIGAPAAPALANVFNSTNSKIEVCDAAVNALGKIGGPAAISALTNALHDANSDVRRITTYALGDIGGPAAIPALTIALNDTSSDVRRNAVNALGKIGDPVAIPALTSALNDADAKVRYAAVNALDKIGDSATLSALINKLNDADAEVRRITTYTLGKIGGPAAIPALTNALNNTDSGVRQIAVSVLVEIGGSAAIPTLTNALNSTNSDVRRNAAFALGRIGDPAAIPALTNALNDADAEVRYAAVNALGKIGDPAAIPALTNALHDADAKVRHTASQALRELQNS